MIHLTIKGVGHRMALDPTVKDDREAGAKLIANAVSLRPNKRKRRKA